MKYGQFCPIAKAAEVLGERWTLLVLRELLSGATRYRDLQRGLGRISSSVLSARIKTLIDYGIVEKLDTDSANGFEYRLTEAGAELAPIVESIGVWGQRWVRSRMSRDELDLELLMLSVQRNFDASALGEDHAVVAFVFSDLHGPNRRWWLLVDGGTTELCMHPPGRLEDVTLTCGLRTLVEVFAGGNTVRAAFDSGRLRAQGAPKLVRSVQRWLRASPLAAVPPARLS